MRIVVIICKLFRFLFSGANISKTILFNFRLLPVREAIKLPIWLYGNVDIAKCTGAIEWSSKGVCHTGGWIIGKNYINNTDNRSPYLTILEIEGKLVLSAHGRINNQTIIRVSKSATLIIGEGVCVAWGCMIVCSEKVSIGDMTHISWETQIMDTDFHYYIRNEKFINKKNKAISIGSHCWVGNRVTISKGTILGAWSIVASNSLVNKNYGEEGSLYAGIPAVKILENNRRIFEEESFERVLEIDDWFNNHPLENKYSYEIPKQISAESEAL